MCENAIMNAHKVLLGSASNFICLCDAINTDTDMTNYLGYIAPRHSQK